MTAGPWVMAINVAVFNTDLGAAISDLPASFSWTQTVTPFTAYPAITCTCTQLAEGYNLTLVGNVDEVHLEITFQQSLTLLGVAPITGDRVGVTQFGDAFSTNYEVVSAEASQDGIAVTLVVKADHRA